LPQQIPTSSWKETAKHSRHGLVRVLACGWLLCLLGAMLLLAEATQACDTPVYHYTIQMWLRDPYRVYYFYKGAEETGDARVNAYLERIAQGADGHVNLAFAKVAVNALDSVEYTDAHRQIWARHQSGSLPAYVILTPRRTELFVGGLDLDAAKALIDSPKRRQVADQLCQGKQGLLLLLLGPNQAENATAQKIVHEALAEAMEQHQDIGYVEVARDDLQEEWLVRQLLRLEDDLQDLSNTMLFPVFGRGHVLEPYLGKGITQQNLLEVAAFMKGPCACEVKTASAGMDLLTNHNWQARVAHWPQATEAPLNSLLFDIEQTPETEAVGPVSSPGAEAEEEKKMAPGGQPAGAAKSVTSVPARGEEPSASPAPSADGNLVRESQIEDKGEEDATSASAPPAAKPLPNVTAPAGSRQSRQVGAGRTGLAPQVVRELQIEEDSSLGSLLSVRLGVALGTATVLVVALSLAIIWRRRER